MTQRTNLKIWLLIPVFLFVFGSATDAKIICVDDDALVSGDGSSWAAAFKFLQDALDDAASGDEIWVAEGVYTPDTNSMSPGGSGSRDETFSLKNGVGIRGGYAGYGQPDPNARDIELHETILSGDLAGDDGPNFANNGENSYHVVTGSDTDETAVLDGFTITAGNANGSSPNNSGGGMYNSSGNVTLANCTFSRNWGDLLGGGMFNNNSSPTLTNCTFSRNSVSYQGGGVANFNSSPALTNCTFVGNSADRGGGMHNFYGSSVLTNCTFIGNSAGSGGGMRNHYGTSHTLTNCTFSGNSAGVGGGLVNDESDNLILTNCTLSDNSAGTKGGGMWNQSGGHQVQMNCVNCVFSGNSAGVYGGVMYSYYGCASTLTNCTFVANSATYGTILACDDPTQNNPSEIVIRNCILWDDGDMVWNNNDSDIRMFYSDFQGGWWGDGSDNIDADPCFVSGRLGDYYLSQTGAGQGTDSPCVDVGSDTAANLGMDIFTTRTDQAIDTGAVDMGYHYSITNVADIDGDWDVDFADFAVLASQWRQAPGVPSADIEPVSGNGIVNFPDLGLLVDNWLWKQ